MHKMRAMLCHLGFGLALARPDDSHLVKKSIAPDDAVNQPAWPIPVSFNFPITQTTFSEATATNAPASTNAPSIDKGFAFINYSTVTGYFLQDLNTTVPSTFDYTATNFGLINQTYPTDAFDLDCSTQWQRFNRLVDVMNLEAPWNVDYKLLFIARHSEGFHNAEESYVGTPAWNCYYSELTGNSTVTWADARLTNFGISQAIKANNFWTHEINVQKIRTPQSYYSSPLTRCLQTANYTFGNLTLNPPFRPLIKEYLREGISIHTCDRRSNLTYIRKTFPSFRIESSMSENDHEWNGITSETSSAQDYRSKVVLNEIFNSDPSTILSITTHSGEAASILRVLGHRPFSLVTGAVIPVLVRAEKVVAKPSATSTIPWTTSAWCTNGPPATSISGGACVCAGGVAPVATTFASS